MQVIYRNKTSKATGIALFLIALLNAIIYLLSGRYLLGLLWGIMAAASAVLLVFIYRPYVILTSDSLKIQFSPFALREYPLNRLQFYRKEAQYTLLVYEREDGSKEKIKLDHFALDQDDLAAILAALENPGG
jgi:hypothetical protein